MAKFCKKCNAETDRYASGRCKACVREYSAAWYVANADRVRANGAARYAADPESRLASNAAWKAANSEKVRASAAAWYAANATKANERRAAWRAANAGRVRANNAAWSAANPEALRIYTNNRRARKLGNGGTLSPGLAERLFKLQKGKCACCKKPLGKGHHLDHIMPLKLGGSNTDENIQLLRATCNRQKNAAHPVDFMQKRGFLL